MMKSDHWPKEKLTWRKSSLLRREYELLAGDQLVAFLRQTGWFPVRAAVFPHPKAIEPLLQVERRGIWRQKLHIKTLDYSLPQMSAADLSWRGEVKLVLDNGRSYHLRPANIWHTLWELGDERGNRCLTLQRNGWGFGGEIWTEDVPLPADELRYLIYVAWNVIIMKMDDAAAAAG
jgi:hypothetical protein